MTNCEIDFISAWPVFFFSFAVILNIKKWYYPFIILITLNFFRIYFYFRITDAVNNDIEKFKKKMFLLLIMALVLVGIVIVGNGFVVISACAFDES